MDFAYRSSSSSNYGRSSSAGSLLTRSQPLDLLHYSGVGAWIEGVPYLVLLHEYLKEFIPLPQPDSQPVTTGQAGQHRSGPYQSGSSSGAGRGSGSGEGKFSGSSSNGSAGAVMLGGVAGGGGMDADRVSSAERESLRARHMELFMRLALEYWVDIAQLLRRDHHRAGMFRRLMSGAGMSTADNVSGAGSAMETYNGENYTCVQSIKNDFASIQELVTTTPTPHTPHYI